VYMILNRVACRMWSNVSTFQDRRDVARRVSMASSYPVSGGITSPYLGSSCHENMGVMSGKNSAGRPFPPGRSGNVWTSLAAMVHAVHLWMAPVSDRNSLNGIKSETTESAY